MKPKVKGRVIFTLKKIFVAHFAVSASRANIKGTHSINIAGLIVFLINHVIFEFDFLLFKFFYPYHFAFFSSVF